MIPEKLQEMLKGIVQSPETLRRARLRAQAFIRNRKMGFAAAVTFMLDMRKTTLQTRLNLFFAHNGGGEPISQQAFSKLRANFDHSPFETMVRTVVKEEYSGKYELPLWNGFHLFANDGSYLQLPWEKELKQEYGVRGGGGRPSAGVSILYDVLHGWVLDPIITSTNMNEREECEKHIDFLCEQLPHLVEQSIMLLDRGYPSLELLEKLQKSGLKYLARCSSQFAPEINTAPLGDTTVTLKNGIRVRVIKFVLKDGNIETLATNLFDLPESMFPELYALRWGVETAYSRLKQELCVEKLSGKTPNSIRQDFWASMVLMNAVAVFQKVADEEIRERHKDKPVKYEYRARTSDLIITLRDRFIFAVLCGRPLLAKWEMASVIKSIARTLSPVRPGRSFPRRFGRYPAANFFLKSSL